MVTLICGPGTCPHDDRFEHDNYFGCVPKTFSPYTGRAAGFTQRHEGGRWRWPGGCHAAEDRRSTHDAEHLVAIREAIRDLDGSHYPTSYGDGRPELCAVCGAADGAWPCTARMVADDLRRAIGGAS